MAKASGGAQKSYPTLNVYLQIKEAPHENTREAEGKQERQGPPGGWERRLERLRAMADPPAEQERLTPKERERLHAEQEAGNVLSFPILTNDGTTASLIGLVDLKNIFGKQLPKMPKEYIARLVLDRQHMSLACCFHDEVVGGITFRPHPTPGFAEIAFCAVSANHQVRGYGTRIMNQLKEHAKREGITHLLTYADNHAIGYFRKQGFHKQVRHWLACDAIGAPQGGTNRQQLGSSRTSSPARAGHHEARSVARLHQGL